MSTTPRTDAVLHYLPQGYSPRECVSADFARQLELENIKLLEQNSQLKIDIALVREQHKQEMSEFKSDETLITENKKLLEVARAAKESQRLAAIFNDEDIELQDALKSLEESGVKI